MPTPQLIRLVPVLAFAFIAFPITAQTVTWAGTWAASPCAPMTGDARFPSLQIAGKTLREIVHTSAGGDALRLRLTNAYGKMPLHLDGVRVALREKNDRIVAGSSRSVSFNGRADAMIPAGAYLLSDPLPFAVPAQADLAISLYTKTPVESQTVHFAALTTSYIAEGDQTGATALTGSATTRSWLFLAAVEVADPALKGTIVALGSSITDGFASTPDTNHRWPDFLELRLAKNGHARFGVVNEGIGGNRVLHDGRGPLANVFGESASARFDRDVLAQAGVRYVILFEGGNDISQPGSAAAPIEETITAQELIAGYAQLAARAHEHGIRVLGGTLTPFEGMTSNVYNVEREAKRVAVNDWLRTTAVHDGIIDGVIDFDHAVLDPERPSRLLPKFDSGDHLHPNDEGYRALAEAVDLTMFR